MRAVEGGIRHERGTCDRVGASGPSESTPPRNAGRYVVRAFEGLPRERKDRHPGAKKCHERTLWTARQSREWELQDAAT
jgi:hypothetical protein